MDIRQFAKDFTIYIFAGDISYGAGIKVALSQVGYDAYFFEDEERLQSRCTEKAPHLLLFPTSAAKNGLSQLMEKILHIDSEIKFIIIAQPDQFDTMILYREHGLIDLLTDDQIGLNSRVLFSVDRACEKLYLTYQNEQLYSSLLEKQEALAQTSSKESSVSVVPRGPEVDLKILWNELSSFKSKEELLRAVLLKSKATQAIFLKAIPALKSFVATQSIGSQQNELGQLQVQLEQNNFSFFEKAREIFQLPSGLLAPIDKKISGTRRLAYCFQVQQHLEGLFIFSYEAHEPSEEELERLLLLSNIAFERLAFEKKIDALEVQDMTTELPNRKSYVNRLGDEWSRARRSQQPLSVLKVAIDHFYELEKSIGETAMGLLLKNIAVVIQKTSRSHDFVARTGKNEFSVLLPQCDRQGAMLRAERVRRTVEGTQMIDHGLKISVSQGLAEYPSHCQQQQELDALAAKALEFIIDKGGNKICSAKAPPQFSPDFVVPSSNPNAPPAKGPA